MTKKALPGPVDRNVSRRSFIKRAGAGLLAGAVAASMPRSLVFAQGESWDRETDVLVLGAGAAGLAAAIAARQAGRSVLVVERAPNPGGSSRRSGGVLYLGGGTPPQLANGFDDTPDNMYDYLFPAMGIGAEPQRVRAFCDGSVELYEWLVDIGVPFNDHYVRQKVANTSGIETLFFSGSERSHPYSGYAEPMPRGHKVEGEGSTGHVFLDVLFDYAADSGVEFEFDARVRDVVREDGRVVGVVVERNGGSHRFGASGGVVIATGGFQMNQDLVALHCPQYLQTAAPLGAPEEDGDGLTMGQRLGSQVLNLDRGSPWKFMYPPDEMVKSVLVGPNGQRFITEDIYGGNACDIIVRRLGSVAHLIYDDAIRAEVVGQNVNLNPVAHADTLEELAEQIGVLPAAFVDTISFYNDHAARGEDPLFHKKPEFLQPLETPPYFAIDYSGVSGGMVWITLGGLRTDASGRVLDVDGAPVPGLYAAGRAAAALGGIYNSGTSLSDCAYFGRAAGMHAASEATVSVRAVAASSS